MRSGVSYQGERTEIMGGAIITRAKFEREWNERDDRLREPTKKKACREHRNVSAFRQDIKV